MVLWSVDTGDYLQPGVEAIVATRRSRARTRARSSCMHDGGGDPQRDDRGPAGDHHGAARARATSPVTVPQLMLDDPPPGRAAAAAEPERD